MKASNINSGRIPVPEATQALSIFALIIASIVSYFEIGWFINFWKQRRNPFVAKREPTMFLVQFSALLIWTVNWNALSVIDAFKNELEDPAWDAVLVVLGFGTSLSWTVALGVGMARLWVLFWKINVTAALKNDQWASVINSAQWTSNWYLKHQRDYGSWRWIKWKLAIWALTAFVALEGVNYLWRFEPNWFHDLKLSIVYGICYFWLSSYYALLPLWEYYYVLRHMISDDAIGLKKEKRTEGYMVLVVSILTTMYNVSFLIRDMWHYWSLIWRTWTLLVRILLFLMLNLNTRWVLIKYGFLMRQKPENNSRDPRAIRLTSRQMRHFAHDTTFCLVRDESTFSLTNDEQTDLLLMRKTLINYKAFESFMHYILDEYFQNELLSIIEMLQFKDRVFNEQLTAEQQRLVTSSQSSWRITSHFLILPQDGAFPRSDIVYGGNDSDYKGMVSKIYLKYVKEESDYEINVDWATRNDLENVLDPERWEQDDEKEIEAMEPLNLYSLFDDCLLQSHSLILQPFGRWRNSDDYKLIDIQSRPNLIEDKDKEQRTRCSNGIIRSCRC